MEQVRRVSIRGHHAPHCWRQHPCEKQAAQFYQVPAQRLTATPHGAATATAYLLDGLCDQCLALTSSPVSQHNFQWLLLHWAASCSEINPRHGARASSVKGSGICAHRFLHIYAPRSQALGWVTDDSSSCLHICLHPYDSGAAYQQPSCTTSGLGLASNTRG